MSAFKTLWSSWREKSANLSRWVLIPGICYLELLFHYWIGAEFAPELTGTLLGFGLCLGGLLNVIAAFLSRKASRWFSAIAIFLCTTVMMVELLIGDAYFNFMRPALVFVSAGGVLTDFSDIMIDMIFNNLGRIAIALIPFWLLLLSGKASSFQKKRCAAASAAVAVIGACLGLFSLNVSADGLDQVIPQYDFNNSMRRNGITVSMFMELSGLSEKASGLNGGDFEFDFEPESVEPAATETELTEAASEVPSNQAPSQ